MNLQSFVDSFQVGNSYPAPDGSYLGECVSLVKQYIKKVMGVNPQSIGDAHCYWEKRNENYLSSMFIPVPTTMLPEVGDVFVRTSGPYGHVGIVIRVDSNYFYTIEQNNGGNRIVTKEKYPFYNGFNFLRPKENVGDYNGLFFIEDAPTSKTITYTKMSGKGKIISDFTDLLWYIDNSETPKKWGFYGMADEKIDFIGIIDNKYYYGWINGSCRSKIKCLVPKKKVKMGTGRILKGTGSFVIGIDYSAATATFGGTNDQTPVNGQSVSALFTVYGPPWNEMEGGNAYAWSGHGTPIDDLNKGVYACAAPPEVPFGTRVQVTGTGTKFDGRVYIVKDRGGAIKIENGRYHFDLLVQDRLGADDLNALGTAILGN